MSDQGISIWAYVIGSATAGALVSAAVTFLGQYFERRARRKELLLSKAIDLAFRYNDVMIKIAEKAGATVGLRDDIMLTVTYFKELQHLIDKGDVTARLKAVEEKSRKAVEAQKNISR